MAAIPCSGPGLEVDVPQCGYCQSGQIMTAAALLTKTAQPTDADIDEAMRGNICRCGTYQAIRQRGAPGGAVSGRGQSQRTVAQNVAGRRRSMSATLSHLNRRGFLKAGAAAAGGLLIGFHLPESSEAGSRHHLDAKLNAYIHIGSDDIVTFIIHKAEMGQGPMTSLSSCWPKSWSAIGSRSAPNSRRSIRPTAHCKASSAA